MSDMHDSYSLDQYINVGLYMVGMVLLFIGIGFIAKWLDNKLFGKSENKIYSIRKRNNKEKKWFYDVA
jgi:hypothetical protein